MTLCFRECCLLSDLWRATPQIFKRRIIGLNVKNSLSMHEIYFVIMVHHVSTPHGEWHVLCCFQFGPDADVKLFRSGPEAAAIQAATLDVYGKVRAEGFEVNGVSLEQLIRKILKEMLEKEFKWNTQDLSHATDSIWVFDREYVYSKWFNCLYEKQEYGAFCYSVTMHVNLSRKIINVVLSFCFRWAVVGMT